jgi:hypothetical protein
MSITRREWRNVLIFAVILVVITSLPYWLAWGRASSEWSFTGFLFGTEDGASYIGKMRLGARGILDFFLFYTPDPHESAGLLFLPYILPGWIVGRFISPDDPALYGVLVGVFHLMRIGFSLLLIGVLYRFIAMFIEKPFTRMIALILGTFGGGLGFLQIFTGGLPLEFYVPEGFSFLIHFSLPHLALGRAALLGGLLLLIQAGRTDKTISLPQAIAAGLCWCVVGLSVPFYLAVLYAILGMWGLVDWIRSRRFPLRLAVNGIVAAGITLPLFLYFNWVFSSNPVFSMWSAQNILLSPPPLDYVLSYGVLVALAGVGIRRLWQGTWQPYDALLAWPIVVPVLVYLPMITVQRRLAEAVLIPLAILAALGLEALASRGGLWKRLRVPVVAVLCASSALFWMGILLTGALAEPIPPRYRPAAELRLWDWMQTTLPAESVVLSAFDANKLQPAFRSDTGNVLPVYTSLRPYVGHGPETVGSTEKDATTRRFYQNQMTAEERAALYDSVNIVYVIYGPQEREVESGVASELLEPVPLGAPPSWTVDGTLIYDADGYQVYQLNR